MIPYLHPLGRLECSPPGPQNEHHPVDDFDLIFLIGRYRYIYSRFRIIFVGVARQNPYKQFHLQQWRVFPGLDLYYYADHTAQPLTTAGR